MRNKHLNIPMAARLKLLLVAVVALLGLANCSPKRELPLTQLSNDLEPLRTVFNQDAGKVRLLLLVDPT